MARRGSRIAGYRGFVPCLVLLLAFFSPRLALVAMALFSDVLSRSMDGILVPFIGFVLAPWTTLAYALAWNYGTNEVAGLEWVVVGVALLVDLGIVGGGARSRSRRS